MAKLRLGRDWMRNEFMNVFIATSFEFTEKDARQVTNVSTSLTVPAIG